MFADASPSILVTSLSSQKTERLKKINNLSVKQKFNGSTDCQSCLIINNCIIFNIFSTTYISYKKHNLYLHCKYFYFRKTCQRIAKIFSHLPKKEDAGTDAFQWKPYFVNNFITRYNFLKILHLSSSTTTPVSNSFSLSFDQFVAFFSTL